MSPETARRVGDFASAVLTFIDESGYPYSVRCRAEPEGDGGLVRVHIPSGVPVAPGPAGLLCHSHDQELWNQQSFTARGRIRRHGGACVFSPESHVEGLGKGGLRGLIRMMLTGRRRADEYLRVRGLSRPAVPWEDLKAIKREVFGAGSAALLGASALYLANAGLGTWLAIEADLPGRPLGPRTGLAPLWDFVFGLGTALSAPLVLLLALVVLNALIQRGGAVRRRAAGDLALLGTGVLVGVLVEPITWRVLHPSGFDPALAAAVVSANLLLPAAIVALSLRARSDR